MPTGPKQHTWSEGDDLVAFYIFRHGTQALSTDIDKIASLLGMSKASLIMRTQNFRSLSNGRGLTNVAKQTKRIYEIYGSASEADVRTKAIFILAKKSRK